MNDDQDDSSLFMSEDLQGRFTGHDEQQHSIMSLPMLLSLVFVPVHILVSKFSFARTYYTSPRRRVMMIDLEINLPAEQALEEYAFHVGLMMEKEVVPTQLIHMDYGAENKLEITEPFALQHVGIEYPQPDTGTLHFKLIQLRPVS